MTVTQASDGDRLEGHDVLVIGIPRTAGATALFAGAPVRIENGRLRVVERNPIQRVFGLISPYGASDVGETNAFLTTAERFDGFVSFRSPYDAARTVVAVLAPIPPTCPSWCRVSPNSGSTRRSRATCR